MKQIKESPKKSDETSGLPFKTQIFGGFDRDDVLNYIENLIKKLERDKLVNDKRKDAMVDMYCDTKLLCEKMIMNAKSQASEIQQEALKMKKDAEKIKQETIEIKIKTEAIKSESEELCKNILRIQDKAHSIEDNADLADRYAHSVSKRDDITINIDDIELKKILDKEYFKSIGDTDAIFAITGESDG